MGDSPQTGLRRLQLSSFLGGYAYVRQLALSGNTLFERGRQGSPLDTRLLVWVFLNRGLRPLITNYGSKSYDWFFGRGQNGDGAGSGFHSRGACRE